MIGSLFLAALQLPAASEPVPEAPVPVVEAWPGSLAEGLAEMERLATASKPDEALAVGERLLAPNGFARWREGASARPGWKRSVAEAAGSVLGAFGLADLSDAERATVQHARGVVLAQAPDDRKSAAIEAFDRARALAGPGSLRFDATYDAAWTRLTEGEALRATLPEISGASATTLPAPTPSPTPAPASAGAAPGQPPEPDPLELALAAYRLALDRFVDGVKLDPDDADTRANLELVHKRIRELEELRKKREEEKKQEQKDQQQEEKDSKDPKQDDSEPKDDSEKKDDEKKDSESKPKPDEKPPKDPAEPEPQPQDPSDPQDPKQEPKPKPSKEELLTREEVMRLLDILKDREEEGKKLLEQLRAARRVSVKKDW
jgi:hypothetical protein